MQAMAAEFSGYAGKIPLLFGQKSLKTVYFDSFILKQALKQARSVCLSAGLRFTVKITVFSEALRNARA